MEVGKPAERPEIVIEPIRDPVPRTEPAPKRPEPVPVPA